MRKNNSISLLGLKQILNKKIKIRVIDVRSCDEHNEKHIPMAENFHIDRIENGEFTDDDSEVIVTACGKGGGRSARAASIISEKYPLKSVYLLEGGTFGWFENTDV